MADGDAWSLDRTPCNYEADNGGTYRFRALEAYQVQGSLGWVVCTDATLTRLPPGFKPRVWLTWDPAAKQNRRRVVVATNAAWDAGVIDTTTVIVQNPSTDVEDTFTVYGKEGERHRGVQAAP